MFQGEISGLLLLLIAVFLGPALIMAGFQTMAGQRVRLPSPVKPLCKAIFAFAEIVLELAGVVASVVAESLPEKYQHMATLIRLLVRFAIVFAAILVSMNFLPSLAGK